MRAQIDRDSADKLLGGPQAGIVAGATELVQRCRRHPMMRTFRTGSRDHPRRATDPHGVCRRPRSGHSALAHGFNSGGATMGTSRTNLPVERPRRGRLGERSDRRRHVARSRHSIRRNQVTTRGRRAITRWPDTDHRPHCARMRVDRLAHGSFRSRPGNYRHTSCPVDPGRYDQLFTIAPRSGTPRPHQLLTSCKQRPRVSPPPLAQTAACSMRSNTIFRSFSLRPPQTPCRSR